MKRLVFLLASVLLIGLSSVNAQDVLKFKSFDFFKGVVSVDHNSYDSFTFALKLKDKSNIVVYSVLVNGVESESQVYKRGVFEFYTVKIPKMAHAKVGKQFEVTINFTPDGGFLMGATLAATGDDLGDGGPGGGGDPTVIIIKYP
ncbi:MAG: hypothetical protein U9N86_11690 [Bacteroidota bacterium]|nr:hypothetical protein [Bacteroidota bacterium]